MSFLSPLLLGLGVAAAAVVVALHLLTTRRPPPAPLPTARFVPVSEARAVSRARRPTDLPLLLLRALAVLLVGAAFARPVLDAPGPAVRSVVLLDRSSGVADAAEAGRAARAALGEGGALVVFDTIARPSAAESLGVAPAAAPRAARGILSAAFVAGLEAARRIAPGADSVRLVVVSPLAGELFDAATPGLRAAWPGSVELVRVRGAGDTAAGPAPALVTPLEDDPLAPALARAGTRRGGHAIRVVRASPAAADSTWVRAGDRVLLHWPLATAADSAKVRGDAVTAFGLREATVVAPLARLPLDAPAPGRALARWRDGNLAAVETSLGAGCVRRVGVGMPTAGDLTLRAAFVAFLEVLLEPCGGARGMPADSATLARHGIAAREGGEAAPAVPAAALTAAVRPDGRLAALLLALALVALGAEWALRRRGTP